MVRLQKQEDVVDESPACYEESEDNVFVQHEDVEFDLTQHEIQKRRARQLQRRQALIKLVSCFNMGERPNDDGIDTKRRHRPSGTTVTHINASVSKTNYRSVHKTSTDPHRRPADL